MIYIEVIFGSVNGNAITVDSAMSNTSTNPVQNKVIKAALDALQRNIDAVAGSITKDVVEVETYEGGFLCHKWKRKEGKDGKESCLVHC